MDTAVAETIAPFDLHAILKEGSQSGLIPELREALQRVSEQLDNDFRDGRSAGELLRARAALIDDVLRHAWETLELPEKRIALVAVGGYGRGELHPHSDIDLLVLRDGENEEDSRSLESFLTLLWDLGLQIGHSVRSVEECISQALNDVTVLTNLIEARLLLGEQGLLDAVAEGTQDTEMWAPDAFFKAKLTEQEARHAKFGDTEYSLEPNVKGSPGGLRDLQLIGWLAQRHFGWSSVAELTANDFLTDAEATTVIHGQEFMWRVRYALHMITGREEDRLLFDHQRELARLWGFVDGDKLAVEQFMQLYYRWALALSQLNEVLMLSFDQAVLQAGTADIVLDINEWFELRNGYICAKRDSVFEEYPGALLEVFLHAGNNPQASGIAAETIRLIRENRHLIDDDFRRNDQNKQLFLEVLRSNNRLTRQLRRMSRYGILGRYLPAYGQIVGQMQHDLFHSYTVDAHTLQVIENIRRFLKPENDERFPVTSRVARRLPKIELLYITGLFHDIGKGRGGDHSELGAVDARTFCEDHGLSRRDTNLVEWLVRNHLFMSAVSQRKDISDPDVVQEFAEHVGDQNRLDYLFALTVADINGTNPKLWNAWRGSLLRQLYTESKRALRRGLENPVDKQDWIAETREAAAKILEYRGFTESELASLWQERGEDYFLREKAEDIAWHTEAIADHQDQSQPLILVRNGVESSVANTTQIFIYARFDIGTFSRTCSRIEQLDLSVHDARIYHGRDGMSLDTYFVLDSSGKAVEDADRLRHITTYLNDKLSPETDSNAIPTRLTPRRVRSFRLDTETSMRVDPVREVSVLEVISLDRPGLLARIGEVFVEFGVICEAAKIQTLGERVEDVFCVTDTERQPIADEQLAEQIQSAIRDTLDSQESQ
ncbi:[protein-PII] uridylyltransferase [Congregibacter brevis]|uniref:Bifunctional uridylyltransferase/uridylyl-removing enzyme n=1 Tax=Congregibacter brevis TaxID=3081201 RepID=A0ABZ0IBC4_9GAMM|nr:[protein-PII] uridylyltransferase [Congregibacter sp. IMCC45268]